MSELKKVDEGLPPEVVALAQALRDLFQGLGVSTRRYAARRSYDSSTVSRYLSGRRLPPWEFVLNLLHDVAEERGNVPTEETIGMLRALHTAALRSGNSPVHQVQLLQRRLAEADQEARRAALRERVLEDTLQDREHRIRDLQLRYRELQASAREGLGDAAPSGETTEEHARLRAEIHDLQTELTRVRAQHRQAEERCAQLERQLEEAERAAGRAGEVALVPEAFSGAGTLHSSVTVFTGNSPMDEEYVESVTVQVVDAESGHRGNGLLVDAETVVTLGYVLAAHNPREPDPPVFVMAGGRTIPAARAETHPVIHRRRPYSVVTLLLSEPLPVPDRSPRADLRPPPGSQLMVSAHTLDGPYSCLLEVKGRTGDWLRVSGEIEDGLAGAPAFSGTGGLAGLVATRDGGRDRGHILPVSALQALAGVNLSP